LSVLEKGAIFIISFTPFDLNLLILELLRHLIMRKPWLVHYCTLRFGTVGRWVRIIKTGLGAGSSNPLPSVSAIKEKE